MKIESQMRDVLLYSLEVEETRVVNGRPEKSILPTEAGDQSKLIDCWTPSANAISAQYIYSLQSPLKLNTYRLRAERSASSQYLSPVSSSND